MVQRVLQAPQTLAASEANDGPCQPKPASPIPVHWLLRAQGVQHRSQVHLSLMESIFPGPLSTSGELEPNQSERCGVSWPLTSAQENIISLLLSLCPRFTQLVRKADGVPTPLSLCGQPQSCVFWQITDILPIDRPFPVLFTHRVSAVQCSVKSQRARRA